MKIRYDRSTNTFSGLDESALESIEKAFPDVDLTRELMKMSLWLQSPKGIRRKGTQAFILSWLGNAPRKSPGEPAESPLMPLVERYLESLWHKNRHLLELNTRHS
jgi:hypothetical protein